MPLDVSRYRVDDSALARAADTSGAISARTQAAASVIDAQSRGYSELGRGIGAGLSKIGDEVSKRFDPEYQANAKLRSLQRNEAEDALKRAGALRRASQKVRTVTGDELVKGSGANLTSDDVARQGVRDISGGQLRYDDFSGPQKAEITDALKRLGSAPRTLRPEGGFGEDEAYLDKNDPRFGRSSEDHLNDLALQARETLRGMIYGGQSPTFKGEIQRQATKHSVRNMYRQQGRREMADLAEATQDPVDLEIGTRLESVFKNPAHRFAIRGKDGLRMSTLDSAVLMEEIGDGFDERDVEKWLGKAGEMAVPSYGVENGKFSDKRAVEALKSEPLKALIYRKMQTRTDSNSANAAVVTYDVANRVAKSFPSLVAGKDGQEAAARWKAIAARFPDQPEIVSALLAEQLNSGVLADELFEDVDPAQIQTARELMRKTLSDPKVQKAMGAADIPGQLNAGFSATTSVVKGYDTGPLAGVDATRLTRVLKQFAKTAKQSPEFAGLRNALSRSGVTPEEADALAREHYGEFQGALAWVQNSAWGGKAFDELPKAKQDAILLEFANTSAEQFAATARDRRALERGLNADPKKDGFTKTAAQKIIDGHLKENPGLRGNDFMIERSGHRLYVGPDGKVVAQDKEGEPRPWHNEEVAHNEIGKAMERAKRHALDVAQSRAPIGLEGIEAEIKSGRGTGRALVDEYLQAEVGGRKRYDIIKSALLGSDSNATELWSDMKKSMVGVGDMTQLKKQMVDAAREIEDPVIDGLAVMLEEGLRGYKSLDEEEFIPDAAPALRTLQNHAREDAAANRLGTERVDHAAVRAERDKRAVEMKLPGIEAKSTHGMDAIFKHAEDAGRRAARQIHEFNKNPNASPAEAIGIVGEAGASLVGELGAAALTSVEEIGESARQIVESEWRTKYGDVPFSRDKWTDMPIWTFPLAGASMFGEGAKSLLDAAGYKR